VIGAREDIEASEAKFESGPRASYYYYFFTKTQQTRLLVLLHQR
jgi:hypothetical protein